MKRAAKRDTAATPVRAAPASARTSSPRSPIGDRRSKPGRPNSRVEQAVTIDEIDLDIIEQLQADGRRTYTRLADEVGLSEAAVRQRVQRLVDGGVMQIVAVTDPLTVGFHRAAMIGLKVEGDLRAVAQTAAAIAEIDYVVITSGSFDILLEITCEDDEQLLALLNDKIRAIPGVRSTETFLYIKLVKQTYSWGTR